MCRTAGSCNCGVSFHIAVCTFILYKKTQNNPQKPALFM